jgi:hypothetical protein
LIARRKHRVYIHVDAVVVDQPVANTEYIAAGQDQLMPVAARVVHVHRGDDTVVGDFPHLNNFVADPADPTKEGVHGRSEFGFGVGGIGVSEAEVHVVSDAGIQGVKVATIDGIQQSTNDGSGLNCAHGQFRSSMEGGQDEELLTVPEVCAEASQRVHPVPIIVLWSRVK